MTSPECKLPVIGSAGHEALFDIHSSMPGDFVHPVLFDDETWSYNTSAEMAWVFFKGDPMSEPTPRHPIDMPFTPSTLFSIELLDSANSTLLSVMRESAPGVMFIPLNTDSRFLITAPTNSTPFWDAGAPFGRADGKYMLTIPRFTNRSCPINTFGLMMYRWTVPIELATNSKYRFRLSTNDSNMLHFSGEVTVQANHALKSYSTTSVGCRITTFNIGGILALGILLVLGWMSYTRFLRRRHVRYEPLVEDEKALIQSWGWKMTDSS